MTSAANSSAAFVERQNQTPELSSCVSRPDRRGARRPRALTATRFRIDALNVTSRFRAARRLPIASTNEASTTARISSDPLSGSDTETCGRTRMWRFRHVAKRYVNPVTRPLARRLPAFGLLTYQGRKTGRTYQTPINVFRRGDAYFFFLTYGSDVEWVKNILSTGRCSLETRGQVVELVEPELITDPELRPAPPVVRFVERRIAGVTNYLRMRAAPSA
jgi:deazaflavin-dependent oxidoreductase (nitroreductase family)